MSPRLGSARVQMLMVMAAVSAMVVVVFIVGVR
jgi:hypothetical protein